MTGSKVNVKVKVKVTEVRHLRIWSISKYIRRGYACNQKTNGKFWYTKAISKF